MPKYCMHSNIFYSRICWPFPRGPAIKIHPTGIPQLPDPSPRHSRNIHTTEFPPSPSLCTPLIVRCVFTARYRVLWHMTAVKDVWTTSFPTSTHCSRHLVSPQHLSTSCQLSHCPVCCSLARTWLRWMRTAVVDGVVWYPSVVLARKLPQQDSNITSVGDLCFLCFIVYWLKRTIFCV